MLDSFEKALKENKNVQKILETTLKTKNDIIAELQINLTNLNKEKEISNVDINGKKSIISKLEKSECSSLGKERIEELHELVETKTNRIAELEDILRDSIKLATEREMVLQEEEKKRRHILEKVNSTLLNILKF